MYIGPSFKKNFDYWLKMHRHRPLQQSSLPLQIHYLYMTSLRHLDEAALVKNLHDRWVDADRKPYTRISNILIAVNPLRYSDKPIDKTPYVHQSLDKSPPHPFHIAENAFRQMRSLKQNQSIIISGESGSGKTETSKIILDFLTERSGLVKVDDKCVRFPRLCEVQFRLPT
ncbi:unnamed protein product [Aphanomyces euteiches]